MAKRRFTPDGGPLPGTRPLETQGDFAEQMVGGIDRALRRQLAAAPARRARRWKPDASSHAAWEKSCEPARARLGRMIGLVDEREAPELEVLSAGLPPAADGAVARGKGYRVFAVRWQVLKGVDGEGLLLEPDRNIRSSVVALPDCDWSPEMLAGLAPGIPPRARFARRLAENRCRVIVPALLDRADTHSGNPRLAMTGQPHREFVYRAAFQVGRHIIGYEVQKVLGAVDWLLRQDGGRGRAGVIGYGEGGLLALYAAAVDTRLDAAGVCGCFGPREGLWEEPIYRNVFGLLDEFGDAELAALVAPRSLVLEACRHPYVEGPPRSPGRVGGARGVISTPPADAVEAEFARARELIAPLDPAPRFELAATEAEWPGSEPLLRHFLGALGHGRKLAPSGSPPSGRSRNPAGGGDRMRRQFQQLVDHTQQLLAEADFRRREFWIRGSRFRKEDAARKVMCRDDYLLGTAAKGRRPSPGTWERYAAWYRRWYWEKVIGRLPAPRMRPNPRTRVYQDAPAWTAYEVVLDLYPDVFTYGLLLVPKDLKPGEKRPLVVCQHGLEGRPRDLADLSVENPNYHRFGCRLAGRGFVVYAPQNPYIGGDAFRTLERLANPMGKTFFAFVVRQHQRHLEWLASLPFVDPKRMAFYGLSYGGLSAVRIPAILQDYCLSICSANFSEWNWKAASTRSPYSYMFSEEWEMPDFNLANTFGHAELSWLISPRPFMVERGTGDPVGPDEWVSYEFAKTRRHYMLMGSPDRAELEIFEGGHEINGEGTFRFLERHLRWPPRSRA